MEKTEVAIAEIKKDIHYLIELNENWNRKTDQMRESYNGRFHMAQKDIKGLIERQVEIELKQKEFEPTHTFITDLRGKILTGFIALLALIGSVIYASIKLLDKK